MFNKCLVAFGLVAFIAIYFPARHARHYSYVENNKILQELVPAKAINVNSNLKICSYQDVVLNGTEIEYNQIYTVKHIDTTLKGGEYIPKTCIPLYRTAIVVPYRNRSEQLSIFLNYMHKFLQKQNLHYRIFIVDQNDTQPFNRGKMLNYGAKIAMSLGMECLILHDVDLLPLNSGNIYACGRKPRHMSSSIDIFRYNLPYLELTGGAVAILSKQFQKVNGLSNNFDGWGAEDDDFYTRLEALDLVPYRFSPAVSKYIMLKHRKEKGSEDRYEKLKYSIEKRSIDGLNTLKDNITVKLRDLYTHVIV